MDQYASDGKPIAHTFGYGDQPRDNSRMLEGKERSAAPVTGLHFVEDEHGVLLAAGGGNGLQKGRIGNVDPSDALNALHHHGADIALRQALEDAGRVIQFVPGHLEPLIDRGYDLWVVGYAHCR